MLSFILTVLLAQNIYALDFSTITYCRGEYKGLGVVVEFPENHLMKIDFHGEPDDLVGARLTYKVSNQVRVDSSYPSRKTFSQPVHVETSLVGNQKIPELGKLEKINIFTNAGYIKDKMYLSGKTDQEKSFYLGLSCSQPYNN